MWMDWVFAEAFGFDVQFSAETSDLYYDRITEALATDAFRPRALFDRLDRKSVVSGKSVSVRVDLGGRRILKTITQKPARYTTTPQSNNCTYQHHTRHVAEDLHNNNNT